MDFFQSHQTVPKPFAILPSSIFERSIALVTGWFAKGWNWSQPAYANKVLLKVARVLPLMDFFRSHQTVPKPLLSSFSSYSRTFNCTSKRLAGSPRAEIDPNLPPLTKCYSKVAHAFLYTWMDFFQSHQTVKTVAILLLLFERSIALVKRLAGSQRLKWSTCYANKVLLR
jgi:hypothetical protein